MASVPMSSPHAEDTTVAQDAPTRAGSVAPPAGAGADGADTTAAPPAISKRRLILVDVLIGFTTVLAVIGMLSIWANRLLFNPDQWADTSTQLLQNDTIRTTTANYVVGQVYAHEDVAAIIKSGLPSQLAPLAGPAAGALQNAAVQGVDLILGRPEIQSLWAQANRAADQTLVAIVNGRKGSVAFDNGVVSLDLASIVDQTAANLGLPALGSKLPPSAAHLTIFKSDQLKLVQNGGKAVKGLALWLTIIVPLLYLLAILLAVHHRRRTLMTVGFAIVLAGVLGVAGRSILESRVTDSLVTDASLRPAVSEVLHIATGLLGTIAGAFILIGLVLALAAWFAGPARIATAARRVLAPYLRDQTVATFATVVGIMVLIFIWQPIPATGQLGGILVFLALALVGTELLRRQTAEEFPDVQPGEAAAAIRARWHALRSRSSHGGSGASSSASGSLTDQLERLAALHHDGTITDSEYESAKASVLRRL